MAALLKFRVDIVGSGQCSYDDCGGTCSRWKLVLAGPADEGCRMMRRRLVRRE